MEQEFKLNNHSIDKVAEDIEAFFTKRKLDRIDIIRLKLLAEEYLLRLRDKFGEDQDASIEYGRWNLPYITIKVKGDAFNPLKQNEAEDIENSYFIQNLLGVRRVFTTYRYINSVNRVILGGRRFVKLSKIPGGTNTVAAILGVVVALACKNLPTNIFNFLVNDLVGPLSSSLMGLVVLITSPLVFISVISGICALDDIATLSNIGIKAILRFIVITVLLITFTMGISLLFYPGISMSGTNAFALNEIITMLLDLLPKDIFTPFIEGKTIQVTILAVLTGVSILMLADRVPVLKDLVNEANLLIFQLMTLISKTIPLTIFLSIFKAIAKTDASSLVGVWKIVVASILSLALFAVLMLLYVCIRRKINIKEFLSDISPVLLISLSTASSSLSMTKNYDVCRDNLKIDNKLCNFWIPLSHAMFSPSVVSPLVVAAFFCGEFYGTPLSITQIIVMYILVIQLSVASPKVPGGIVATFTILLNQMGVPLDAIGLLMISNAFVVNAVTSLGMLIRDVEIVELSHVLNNQNNA